jgi:hypothetical protein
MTSHPDGAQLSTAAEAPLSCGQERIWFLSRLAPRSTAYLIRYTLRLRGPLDMRALEEAVHAVVDRHETLRTVFATREGRPVQRVRDPEPFPFRVVDLGNPGDEERELDRLSQEDLEGLLDLAAGPLFRLTVIRVADEDHRLHLSLHHIIADWASVDIMLGEIGDAYGARLGGERPPRAPSPVRYAEYARRQREWLDGVQCAQQVAYWREQLAGAPAQMPLGGAVARDSRSGAKCGAGGEPLILPPGTYARLRATARQERASTFMALLAAYGLALGRCYGLDDMVIACIVAQRPFADTEDVIGFFVNTLPVRIRLNGAESFRELVGQVRNTVLDALEHQDLPFERIVAALNPSRRAGAPPFFQVVLNFIDSAGDGPRFPGLDVSVIPNPPIAARTEFALDVEETAEGALSGELLYNPAVQDGDAAARLVTSLRRTVEIALEGPDLRLR